VTRRPELDGIRGLAILLVLVGHADEHLVAASWAGLGLFFVLSGYLITGVLQRTPRRFDFYARRAGRLLPALAIVLAVAVASGWVFTAATAAAYVANWPFALGASIANPFGHLWSLSVEEQFYLVWPFLLALARPKWLVGLAAGVIVGRFFITNDQLMYYSTFTRLDGLALGAALALAAPRTSSRNGSIAVLALVALSPMGTDLTFRFALGAVTILSALIVAAPPAPIARLAPLGRISYSLYLFHWPLYALLGVPGLVLAIPLAAASTVALEEPIRRRVAHWVSLRRGQSGVLEREPVATLARYPDAAAASAAVE